MPNQVDYNFEVQPILSEFCYPCHGPDENTREADLRLDVEQEALRLRNGLSAISPGEPNNSELLARIFPTIPNM